MECPRCHQIRCKKEWVPCQWKNRAWKQNGFVNCKPCQTQRAQESFHRAVPFAIGLAEIARVYAHDVSASREWDAFMNTWINVSKDRRKELSHIGCLPCTYDWEPENWIMIAPGTKRSEKYFDPQNDVYAAAISFVFPHAETTAHHNIEYLGDVIEALLAVSWLTRQSAGIVNLLARVSRYIYAVKYHLNLGRLDMDDNGDRLMNYILSQCCNLPQDHGTKRGDGHASRDAQSARRNTLHAFSDEHCHQLGDEDKEHDVEVDLLATYYIDGEPHEFESWIHDLWPLICTIPVKGQGDTASKGNNAALYERARVGAAAGGLTVGTTSMVTTEDAIVGVNVDSVVYVRNDEDKQRDDDVHQAKQQGGGAADGIIGDATQRVTAGVAKTVTANVAIEGASVRAAVIVTNEVDNDCVTNDDDNECVLEKERGGAAAEAMNDDATQRVRVVRKGVSELHVGVAVGQVTRMRNRWTTTSRTMVASTRGRWGKKSTGTTTPAQLYEQHALAVNMAGRDHGSAPQGFENTHMDRNTADCNDDAISSDSNSGEDDICPDTFATHSELWSASRCLLRVMRCMTLEQMPDTVYDNLETQLSDAVVAEASEIVQGVCLELFWRQECDNVAAVLVDATTCCRELFMVRRKVQPDDTVELTPEQTAACWYDVYQQFVSTLPPEEAECNEEDKKSCFNQAMQTLYGCKRIVMSLWKTGLASVPEECDTQPDAVVTALLAWCRKFRDAERDYL